MNLSEDHIIEKYGKQGQHCNRKTLHPNEYEFTYISCNYIVIRPKHELPKVQRKEINFIYRLKYAERKIICICIEVYQLYEGNDNNKL